MEFLEQISAIFTELNDIRTYLIKIGASRRKGEILDKKLGAAKSCYSKYVKILELVKNKSSDTDQYWLLESNLENKIENLYKEILNLCQVRQVEGTTSTMESNFDLKIATALLPIMTDDEDITIKLIDAIELYSSMLNENSQSLLINFVLKTRLSRSAQLRINKTYNDIKSLVKDMRLHLLTQKSDVALQSKLLSARQDNKSINDFGKEIEQLLVDLTISQADGDSSKFDILRPINERNAIKRFADGLRSQRLGTVIAARNYTTLKDAIRAAEDESQSNPPPPFLTFRGRNGFQNYRGRSHYPRSQYSNRNNTNYYHYKNNTKNNSNSNSRRPRYSYYRGAPRSRTNYTRKINYINQAPNHQPTSSTTSENNDSAQKFFRP